LKRFNYQVAIFMGENKGKPSGKYAESKVSPGRKADYKRSGWPEDAPTQRTDRTVGQQLGKQNKNAPQNQPGEGRGRNRKSGSPI
jgi:hypothetical protein